MCTSDHILYYDSSYIHSHHTNTKLALTSVESGYRKHNFIKKTIASLCICNLITSGVLSNCHVLSPLTLEILVVIISLVENTWHRVKRFSSNSEANSSELLENLEEMTLWILSAYLSFCKMLKYSSDFNSIIQAKLDSIFV